MATLWAGALLAAEEEETAQEEEEAAEALVIADPPEATPAALSKADKLRLERVRPIALSFDDPEAWPIASWGDKAVLKALGGPALLTVAEARLGKAAISTALEEVVLSDYAEIRALVQVPPNRQAPLIMTIGFLPDNPTEWNETPPRIVPAKADIWITFDLYRAEWKTAKTEWRYMTSPFGKGMVRSINLLFHGLRQGESVFVKKIVFVPEKRSREVPKERVLKARQQPRVVVEPPEEDEQVDVEQYVLNTLDQYAADLKAAKLDKEAAKVEAVIKAASQ